jgi:hypothetical protein
MSNQTTQTSHSRCAPIISYNAPTLKTAIDTFNSAMIESDLSLTNMYLYDNRLILEVHPNSEDGQTLPTRLPYRTISPAETESKIQETITWLKRRSIALGRYTAGSEDTKPSKHRTALVEAFHELSKTDGVKMFKPFGLLTVNIKLDELDEPVVKPRSKFDPDATLGLQLVWSMDPGLGRLMRDSNSDVTTRETSSDQ